MSLQQTTLAGRTPLQLVCNEVWGGNRPIHAPVELPGVRGWIHSQPCEGGRGGDLHYLSVCGSGILARMCLADVVGHGPTVAAVSAAVHGLLRRYMNAHDQRRVLGRLNTSLLRIGLHALTTAVAVTYYPPTRRLSISYAGHPPAWLYRRDVDGWLPLVPNRAEPRPPLDLPLAVLPQTRFSRTAVRVDVGDRLLLLTDGVLDAPDDAGELFGPERLERLLHAERRAGVQELGQAVLETLTTRAGPRGLAHDDVTLLLVEFVAAPRGPVLWQILKNRLQRRRGNSGDPMFTQVPAGISGA